MTLKKTSYYLILLLLATSCFNANKLEKPKNLIPKDKMVNILIDIKLLTSSHGKNKKTLEDNHIFPESYIYKKYNIDSLQFANSNSYYSFYVNEYSEIYQKIKDSLEALRLDLKKLEELEAAKKQEEAKRKKDSLVAIKKNDSLNLIKQEDSIKALQNIPIKKEKGLITPVSDTDPQ